MRKRIRVINWIAAIVFLAVLVAQRGDRAAQRLRHDDQCGGLHEVESAILGIILVVMRISPISSMRRVAAGYVELFKNMPLTIIMVFMVLGVFAQLKISRSG